MLDMNDVADSFKVPVLVQFAQPNGTLRQGEFKARFRREDPEKLQKLIDDGVANIDLLFGFKDEGSEPFIGVLLEVEGIGRSATDPAPPAEAMAWVKKTPECVNAACFAFFKATRPERYTEETSKKRRSRG